MKLSRYNLALALSILLLVIILIPGWALLRKSQLDDSSQQIVISSLQTVFSANSGQYLSDNAHQSYLLEMSEESFNKYIMSTQRILGPLTSIVSIRGASDASLNIFSGEAPGSSYEVDLIFAKGEATAQIELVYQQGRWQFTGFVIQSDQLVD